MKTACSNVPVSRNGAEPAPRWLSYYIITVRVAYFVAYTRLTTAQRIWHKHYQSLCAWNFLSCLTFCWSEVFSPEEAKLAKRREKKKLPILLKRKFIRQASRRCRRALDPHTDWRTRCHCLLWLGYIWNVTVTRTQQKLPPFNKAATLLVKTQLHIAGSPEKALNYFFSSVESATASCLTSGDLNLVATFSDVCWSGPVSAGTPIFVLDPTTGDPLDQGNYFPAELSFKYHK